MATKEPSDKPEFDEDKLLSSGSERLKIEMIRKISRKEGDGRRPIDSVDEFISFVFTPGWEW